MLPEFVVVRNISTYHYGLVPPRVTDLRLFLIWTVFAPVACVCSFLLNKMIKAGIKVVGLNSCFCVLLCQ